MTSLEPVHTQRLFRRFARRTVVGGWAILCVVGLATLWRYENTPAARTDAPAAWPGETKIDRERSGLTLIMFAHPHCPCTRASLAELERIVAQSGGAIHPRVVFLNPADSDQDWAQTDLWRTAAAIPGAKVTSDPDGAEARRFHATTSGHTLVYSKTGDLLFSGGITASRGHQGDNDGRTAIVSLSSGRPVEGRDVPVYGCPIVTSTAAKAEAP